MRRQLHAERALLGAVLTDPGQRELALRFVQAEDFLRPWHGQVLAAIGRAGARGVVAGPREVYAELKNDADLPVSVSHDAALLADLMHASPRAGHAPVYAGMVIRAAMRRDLAMFGGQLQQAAETGDEPVGDWALSSVRNLAARIRRDVAAGHRRLASLPAQMRQELAAPSPGRSVHEEVAWRARLVRDELVRLREGLWALDDADVARRLTWVAEQVAENAAAFAGEFDRQAGRLAARARGPADAAERAGGAALRDLVADPGQLDALAGWLEPGHFAVRRQAVTYSAMADLRRAGLPVDAVTVSWEAGRRGIDFAPAELSGGCGAFAVSNAVQVCRRAMLARAADAGTELQAGSADEAMPLAEVLRAGDGQLRALDRDLAPGRCGVPGRGGEVVALPGRRPGRAAGPVADREAIS